MGVVSNRVDVRQASARAERALLHGGRAAVGPVPAAGALARALLDEAWRGVILNSAHDSVCACSIDDVCDAVLHRYSEAADIGTGLADRALAALAGRVDHDGPVIVNPTARPRGGVVRAGAARAPRRPRHAAACAPGPGEYVLHQGPPEIVVPAAEEVDWVQAISAFSLETLDGTVLVASQREGTGQMVTADVRARLESLHDTGHLRLKVRTPAQVTVLAPVAEVPGFGWRGWAPADAAAVEQVTVSESGTAGPVVANGLVTLSVDPTDGTFAARRARRAGPAGRRGRLRRHLQLVPADRRHASSTRPTRWRSPWPSAVPCGPGCWSSPATGGPPRARGSSAGSARWPTRCARCSSCRPASGPSASR